MARLAEIAPEAYAAAISPLECPTTDEGETPHSRSKFTRAIWMAVVRGCANSASPIRLVSSPFESSSIIGVRHVVLEKELMLVRTLNCPRRCCF